MNGRRLMIGFLGFVAVFAAALVWFQFFAFYARSDGLVDLRVGDRAVPIADYRGIDATSSPLKRRGCFRVDPAAFAGVAPAARAEPLTAPFWFSCFDAGAITEDLARGAAAAHALAVDEPAGFDLYVAVYPDGRGYLWRQLNARFAD